MNKISKTILVISLLIFLSIAFVYAAEKQKATLKVVVTGLKSNNGSVKIALCNSHSNYKNHWHPFKGASVKIKNRTAVIVFRSLPFGSYGVKAFHDENNDNKLNFAMLGYPKEAYGFSNNARKILGLPSWDVVKFKLCNKSRVIAVKVK